MHYRISWTGVLRIVTDDRPVYQEVLITFLTEIKAILNS